MASELRPPFVEIEVDIVTIETDDAIFCVIDSDEKWIPKSQIADTSEVNSKNDSGTLVIPLWLARKEGLAP